MAVEWHKTKIPGVRFREHKSRKHGLRLDRCFSIRYRVDNKNKEEVVGWWSEGITEKIAAARLAELRENSRTGIGAKTLQEKKEVAIQIEREEKKQKNLLKEQHKTIKEYWENTYKEYAKSTKKASSFRSEEGHMELWILPLIGDCPLIKLTLKEWDTLVSHLNKKELSPRTKEYITGTLRRLAKHAKDRGFQIDIPSSKQIGIQTIQDNRRLRVLSPKEAIDLLNLLNEIDISTYNLTQFAMLTGCRLSEAAFLKWGNINFGENYLHFVNTKNKQSRIFYLSDDLRKLLLSINDKSKVLPNDFVFLRKDGLPFQESEERSEAPYYFVRAVKMLGLNEGRDKRDRLTFHSLRHTVATNLAKVLDVRSLMDVMGWKEVSMAARYIHTHEDTKRNAANILADAWKEK